VSRRPGIGAGVALLLLLTGCGSATPETTAAPTGGPARAAAVPAPPPCPDLPHASAPAPGGLPATRLRCLGDGPAVRLSDLRGTPTVVNFWAAWCTECRAEMPYFRDVVREAGLRVRFVGVHAWAERDFGLQSVTDFGVPFASLDGGDGNEVPASVRVPAPPTTLFVDASGRIVGRRVGALTSEAQLRELVGRYLGVRL
jgi:cytochrome c biogenesis protein CcmG, thiol:disulfide interchange protein DsbE